MPRLFLFLLITLSALANAQEPIRVIVSVLESTATAATLSVRIENTSARPIYFLGSLAGPPFGGKSDRIYPIVLEQWREGRWIPIAPCPDVPIPEYVTLRPQKIYTETTSWAYENIPTVCKYRDLMKNPVGRFRFRVDYFQNTREARAYVKSDQMTAPKRFATSDEFVLNPKPKPQPSR